MLPYRIRTVNYCDVNIRIKHICGKTNGPALNDYIFSTSSLTHGNCPINCYGRQSAYFMTLRVRFSDNYIAYESFDAECHCRIDVPDFTCYVSSFAGKAAFSENVTSFN